MTRQQLSEIICNMDDRHIAEALVFSPEKVPSAHQRTLLQNRRRFVALAVAAALVFSLGIVAYAVFHLGILDLYRPAGKLPEDTETLIEPREEFAEGKGWSARITESLCDATTVLLTVEINGGDHYVVVPTDASAEDPVWVIGRTGQKTLGEYARETGKKLLFVGASLPWEELGISTQGQRTENLSDGEMVLLITANKTVSSPKLEAVCTVYAIEEGSQTAERVKIPFTMTEGDQQDLGFFEPLNPKEIPGLTAGPIHLIKTPLGLSGEWLETVTDEEAFRNILKVEFQELEDTEDGGAIFEREGVYRHFFTMGRGIVSDTLTARFYDWDKQLIGEIVFQKPSEP